MQKFIKFTQKLLKKKIFKTWDGSHLDFTFEKKINNTFTSEDDDEWNEFNK